MSGETRALQKESFEVWLLPRTAKRSCLYHELD